MIDVGEVHYCELTRILFIREKQGLVPIMYGCEVEETATEVKYYGTEIMSDKTDIIYLWLLFIKRSGIEKDSRGVRKKGFLETFQYYISIETILNIISQGSKDMMLAVARQAGKSFLARKLLAFVTVFMPMFTKLKTDRFYSYWGSPSKKLAEDHYGKLKDEFTLAIEFFNDVFPETPLVTKKEDHTIVEDKNSLSIDRVNLNGDQVPHSKFYLLSLDKRTTLAGLTIHYGIVDESQEVNAQHFKIQAQPFTTRTGGLLMVQGTTLPDSTNLLYDAYQRKTITDDRKILFNVKEVRESIGLRSQEDSDLYWQKYVNEVSDYGINSDYIKSQYWVSFNISGDRWLPVDHLQELGVFNLNTLAMPIPKLPIHYRVGSFDSAKKNDLSAYCAGIINEQPVEGGISKYYTDITRFEIVNEKEKKQGKKLTPDDLTQRVLRLCIQDNLDMLVYEATANQDDRAYYLALELRKRGIKTVVIPISYGGTHKQQIYGKAENEFENMSVKLPQLSKAMHSDAYKEVLAEFDLVKKTFSGSTVKYGAPEGDGLHDDFISAIAQMVYLPYYCIACRLKNKTADLGEGYNYPIRMYNQTQLVTNKNRTYSYY